MGHGIYITTSGLGRGKVGSARHMPPRKGKRWDVGIGVVPGGDICDDGLGILILDCNFMLCFNQHETDPLRTHRHPPPTPPQSLPSAPHPSAITQDPRPLPPLAGHIKKAGDSGVSVRGTSVSGSCTLRSQRRDRWKIWVPFRKSSLTSAVSSFCLVSCQYESYHTRQSSGGKLWPQQPGRHHSQHQHEDQTVSHVKADDLSSPQPSHRPACLFCFAHSLYADTAIYPIQEHRYPTILLHPPFHPPATSQITTTNAPRPP